MMAGHWQDIIVAGLIGSAAVYLARMLWFRMSRQTNACCDACDRCPLTPQVEEQPNNLLSLQDVQRRR